MLVVAGGPWTQPPLPAFNNTSMQVDGVFVFSFLLFFINFQKIQKLDDPKNEKLKTFFHKVSYDSHLLASKVI
jgi:hypothetical protein